ncbi:hypothetical protein AC578_8030 [Pseudocercospora eumusae]|uniref:PA14 domain-containing protein n=1 Tax=Pseudocercospora eumusae TaxID=321146 RepID=A0A139HGY9_9PEZI|nr:hypothetical protein AC578_8030 [Pseudocercospora eumusae]
MWHNASLWLLYCALCHAYWPQRQAEHEARRDYPSAKRRLEDKLASSSPIPSTLATTSEWANLSSIFSSSTASLAREASALDSYLEDYHLVASRGGELGKRQAGGVNFVDVVGSITNDCGTAPLYRINNGNLAVLVNGATYVYSTSAGVASQLFVPSTSSNPINTTFSFGAQGTIAWLNPSFYGGQAQFCSDPNGYIYAVFTQYGYPSGCRIVQLQLFSASSCAKLQDQINALQSAVASIQLNTRTVVQRVVETEERTVVSTLPAVTNTPPAETQTLPAVTNTPPAVTVTPPAVTNTPPAVTFTPPAQTQTATRVTTITATTSLQGMLPAPSSCNNQGMQYAVFGNNQPGHVNGDAYSAYDPTYLKARGSPGSNSTWTTLYYNSTIAGVGGYQQSCPNNNARLLYSNAPSTIPCQQWSADYRGYFYVYSTGSWRFAVSGVDDAFVLWLGPLARQGWTKANANLSLAFAYSTGAPSGSFTTTLQAGTYLPMRIVHGQAVGGYGYQFSIQDPNGLVAQNSDSSGSGYVVQNSCDGTTAPPYAYAFGQEQ